MRKLKVWGGTMDGTRRCIVAAPTKKRAVELLNKAPGGVISRYYFDGWWGETGNKKELATATEEGVWVEETPWKDDFKRLV